MDLKFLDFEQPIAELEAKLNELRFIDDDSEIDINEEVTRLKAESETLTKSIFSNLSAWQVAQIARHPMRPYTGDYIEHLAPDFQELHGDRMFADDPAIISGIGRLDGRSVMFIGHQKGRDTKERVRRNYGMPKPEGYRKAQRMMKMAEKFSMPIVTLIDTPGAYPGLGAEERGQAEAIATNLFEMSKLKVPIISVIIGEGGSGGAIALASANKVLMFENAIYSVISPEGCASILWRDPSKSLEAAKAMKLTANELLKMKIIDEIITEPVGGAHRSKEQVISSTKDVLIKHLEEFSKLSGQEILIKYLEEFKKYTREEIFEQRKKKFLNIGKEKTFTVFPKGTSWIRKENFFTLIKEILFKFKKEILIAALLIILISFFLF